MSPTFADHSPSPALGQLVRSIWSLGYRAGDSLPGLITPDGRVEFIFQTGAPCALATASGHAIPTPRAMIFGLRHGTLCMVPTGDNLMVAFRVTPAVASVILGGSLIDCWDRPVALSDLIGADADRLLDRLASAPRADLGAILEQWLLSRLADWDAEDARHFAFQRSLFSAFSGQPVSAAAEAFGVTSRTLRRYCERYAGLSPKQLMMSGRMLRACGMLRYGSGMPIVEIAGRLGFNDQAAFTNAFRHYVETTPVRLRAEPLVFCEPY